MRLDVTRVRGPDIGWVPAVVIYVCWLAGMVALLRAPVDGWTDVWWVVPAICAQAFLYTGMFITAHDAMHGSLSRRHPRLNDALGALCTWSYAAFSYRLLKREHLAHHAHAGQPGKDPDFHDGVHPHPIAWLAHFGWHYTTLLQVVVLVGTFVLLRHGVGIELENLWLFWAFPSWLSTLQLFFVGTWLPHRDGPGRDPVHHARSLDVPWWPSFFACYHFGYHLEHHAAPWAPWWRLPTVRAELRTDDSVHHDGAQENVC